MTDKKKNTQEKRDETTLEKLINKAEKVIIITATNGNIEVTGLKDVNYSHEAKGLLHGAIDSYSTRPIISTITNLSKGLIANLENILKAVTPVEASKNPKKTKEE